MVRATQLFPLILFLTQKIVISSYGIYYKQCLYNFDDMMQIIPESHDHR